jgi:hypothetical protein
MRFQLAKVSVGKSAKFIPQALQDATISLIGSNALHSMKKVSEPFVSQLGHGASFNICTNLISAPIARFFQYSEVALYPSNAGGGLSGSFTISILSLLTL